MSRHTTIVHSDRIETRADGRIVMPGFANMPVDVKLTLVKQWPDQIKVTVTHHLFHVDFDLDVGQLATGRFISAGSNRGFVRPDGDEIVIEPQTWYWRTPVNVSRACVDSFLRERAHI